MKCAFCGNEFNEDEAANACDGCLMSKGCHMLRCPNCGYETPKEPRLIRAIRAWRERKNGTGRKS